MREQEHVCWQCVRDMHVSESMQQLTVHVGWGTWKTKIGWEWISMLINSVSEWK